MSFVAEAHRPALLTIPAAAEALSISPASVRRLIQSGQLPVIKLGRLTRIDPVDLDALVYAHKARPAPGPHKSRHSRGKNSDNRLNPRQFFRSGGYWK